MNDSESAGIAVELQAVTKRFGEFTAVREVTLTIRNGEFFTLLGPSGCGKTTSLRMIAGFEIPSEGEVYIGGQAMGLTPPFQRDTNMVFQNYALFPHMSVFDNVAFGLQMKGAPKAGLRSQVLEALALVQLAGYEDRSPKQLSGGEQQRVALARAIVNRPKVLLLDEPLGALDLKLRKAMQLELKALQDRLGITFIYVTHDQEEALTMSDRIAVMNQGEVLQVGVPSMVYERPTSRFVADFIGETNFLAGKIRSVDNGLAEVEIDGLEPIVGVVAGDWPVGSEATMTVRPEKITISRDRPAKPANVVQGQVQEVIYLGTDTNYLVRAGHGDVIRVRQQNETAAAAEPGFAVGDSVYLSWHPAGGLMISA